MRDEKFQFHVLEVWLNKPLTSEEILQKLRIKPLLKGNTNITGTRGKVKLLIRILNGNKDAARQLDIFADSSFDKRLRSAIQKALPVFTPEDFAVQGKGILEKQREEEESKRWEKAKAELMQLLFDLHKHPKFIQEMDRRIRREIGSPGYHSWAAAGRDPEDHVGALSRKFSYDIVRELAQAMAGFDKKEDKSTKERGPRC